MSQSMSEAPAASPKAAGHAPHVPAAAARPTPQRGAPRSDAERYSGELREAASERTLAVIDRRRSAGFAKRRAWLVRWALTCTDLAGLSLAFLASVALTGTGVVGRPNAATAGEYATFLAMLALWLVAANPYRLYSRDASRANHSTTDDIAGVFHLVTVLAWVWLLLLALLVTPLDEQALALVGFFWALAIPIVTVLRAGARGFCRRQAAYVQNALIVGAGVVGQRVARKILQHPEYGINLVGFVDDSPREPTPGLAELRLLGRPERLAETVAALEVDRVIVAFSNQPHDRTVALVRSLDDLGVQVDVVPRLFDLVGPSAEIHTLEAIPLLGIPALRLSRGSKIMKRAFDTVVSAGALVALAPVAAVIACAIKLDSRGPVFFRQERVGSGGKLFVMFKFRTMVQEAEAQKAEVRHLNKHALPGSDERMFKIPDDPRVTRVGRVLRRHSLDELPQFINVARGEMSLVGPRPLIVEEARHVEGWAVKRLRLKPGITGVWQVLGRSDIPFEDMVKLDYLYVTTWSLWQDVRLLFQTIPVVLTDTRRAY